MQTIHTNRAGLHADRLGEYLIATVPSFRRYSSVRGVDASHDDSGRVHHSNDDIWVVFADDIDEALIHSAIASCPTGR